MANNLEYKDLTKLLDKLGVKQAKPEKVSQVEVNKDWKKLATFMSGRK